MLEGLSKSGLSNDGDLKSSLVKPIIGIGLDSCVIPLKYNNLNLIQTTDFFYPIIDDPYTMGRIACCNVLSDLYAMGVESCDSMLMLLGVSSLMSDMEKKTVIPLMIEGFQECAWEAGTSITGGQTVLNPWLIIGGVATAVCPIGNMIMPNNAQPGDVLILTKPLGTHIAVSAYQWMDENGERYDKIKNIATREHILELLEIATVNMSTLNKEGATLMHKYGARACTDVTGFGILGHASNLVGCQLSAVDFVINSLPCLKHCIEIDEALGGVMKLRRGFSPETSGGLLVIMSSENADSFLTEYSSRKEGNRAWIIGEVEPGSRTARIADNVQFIDV